MADASTGNDWFAANAPPVPAWQIATGAGAAPAGATLPAPGTLQYANGQPTLQGPPPAASGPPTLNPSDPASRQAFIAYYANQPGANPSLKNDPTYWDGKIASGELGSDPNYIIGKFMTPEGAPAGQGAGDLSSYGVPANQYASAPFSGNFNTPAVPSSLSTPYPAAQWTGGDFVAPVKPADLQTEFAAPTEAQLEASPGYEARLTADQQVRQRSAAAKGTILSAGTQVDLGRGAQDYASNEYNNLFGQSLATRQQNAGEYQNSFTDAFQQYQQKYNMFLGQSGLDLGARQQNENEFQSNVLQPAQTQQANQYQQFLGDNARTLNDYLTNYTIGRTGVQDFLNQNNTVANRGLTATTAGRPS